MLVRIIQTLKSLNVDEIRVVCGVHLKLVQSVVEPLGVNVKVQARPLGTGDAVRSAGIEDLEGHVMIVNGDHPLVTADDLKKVEQEFRTEKADLALVSAVLADPKQFGRVVRHQGRLKAIVEAKEASHETLKIQEINTGIYFATADFLKEHLPLLEQRQSQGEVYLTDLVSLGVESDHKVVAIEGTPNLAFGVNTQAELAEATRICFLRKAEQLMQEGVLIWDPRTVYVEESVQVGAGSVLWPQVFLRGTTRIGSFVAIETNCLLMDCEVGDSVQIKANSYLEKTRVHNNASVGPFARLRPETEIGEEAHVGNFVEMKKVKFGKKSKAGHLTYLGDTTVGERVNVGCGTITCNYAVDKKKYRTEIGDDVFVGSDSQFVAPVKIGKGAVIASGSTITKDVPEKALGVARGRQTNIENYVKDTKEE